MPRVWMRSGGVSGLGRLVGAALAGLGLLLLVVTLTPLVSWWATGLAGSWSDPTGDVLIVLAGSSVEGGLLGESSYWRAIYAVLTWREGGFRRVVVSGGPEERPIAAAIGDFLACQGVPREAIGLEIRSRSTRENAVYTTELLAQVPGSKVLLTSDYHMFRAHRAFDKAGLGVRPRPYPDIRKRAASWSGRWPAFLDLLGETAKIGYYYLRGWI